MSENLDIVQRLFAAFERRDVDAMIELCSADMVFEPVTARIAAGGEPYRGREGMRCYMEDIGRIWDELRPAPDTYRETEDGVVVATGRIYAWGTGRVIDAPAGWLWRLRNGQVVYGRIFETAAGALSAAGLPD